MRLLGMFAVLGGAYWFFNRKKDQSPTTQTNTTPETLNESSLYRKNSYSVSMGVRG